MQSMNKRLHPITALMLRTRRLAALCLMTALFLCTLVPSAAHAGYGFAPGTAADVRGTDLEVQEFSCEDPNATMFVNESCLFTGEGVTEQVMGVFAQVICRVENIFGTIVSQIYCSVQQAILAPFIALLTLYVTIYGAMVILGLTRATFQDAIMHVAKMGLVAAVALNAEVGIEVGYKFFISVTQSTGEIVFGAFDSSGTEARSENYDEMVQKGYLVSRTVDPSDIENAGRGAPAYGSHWMQHLDGTLHRIINFFVEGGIGFVIVLLTLLIFFPPLFVVVVYLIYSVIKMLVQAVIGYLLALLGITFLFSMAPIFVCFALFKSTATFFEGWLKQLANFALQMIVIFTALMFAVALDLVGFFQQIGGMIRQYHYHMPFGFIHMGVDVLTLCKVERGSPGDRSGDTGEIVYYRFTVDGELGADSSGSRFDGFPKCVQEYTYEEVEANPAVLPGISSADAADLESFLNDQAEHWEENGLTEKPANFDETLRALVDKENGTLHYSVTELTHASDLIYFLLVRFIAVAVLTYLLERFMRRVPILATRLTSRGIYGRLMPAHYDASAPLAIRQPSAGLQDDPNFSLESPRLSGRRSWSSWAGGSYGMRNYMNYVQGHRISAFDRGAADGATARKAYLSANADKHFLRRHLLGSIHGLRTTIGQTARHAPRAILSNRLHEVLGIGPGVKAMTRDAAYRSLMTHASFGRGTVEQEMLQQRQNLAMYGGNVHGNTQHPHPHRPGHHPRHETPSLGQDPKKKKRSRYIFWD